jgi:multiple sugar transport system permease protein
MAYQPPVAAGPEAVRTFEGVPGRARAERARTTATYVGLSLIALIFFIPFLWSLSTSFKTQTDAINLTLWPSPWTIKGYRDALGSYHFGRYFLNSVGLSVAIATTSLLLASIGGYAFARLRFIGRDVLFFVVLGTLMIPDQLRLVPIYTMLTNFPLTHWNLVDTYPGYWAIKMVSASALFLMRQYFLTIPKDLEEAAKLDGAGYAKTFWRVMLPLAGPALAAVAILEFQGAWNDFFWANLILQSPSHWTLPIGLAQFTFFYQTFWNDLMAGTIIALLPITVLFVFFQRYFVAGVASSGVKG